MPNQPPPNSEPGRWGWWITLGAALAYCGWLGWHWWPVATGDGELAREIARVWDTLQTWRRDGQPPWWTPTFAGGTSGGLVGSHGLYRLPWLLLGTLLGPPVAGKLCALVAIGGGALAMYGCARYYLRNEWAAILAALVFLLHPTPVRHAAGHGQLALCFALPLIPVTWWLFARALDSGRGSAAFWYSLSFVALLGLNPPLALVQAVFLLGYLVVCRPQTPGAARVCGRIGLWSLGLGAFVIVTSVGEWRHAYHGRETEQPPAPLWALVDRDGIITRSAITGAQEVLAPRGGVRSQTKQEHLDRLLDLQTAVPERYVGLVLVTLIAAAVLINRRRVERRLFWFGVGAWLLTVMLAAGPGGVLAANWHAARAVFALEGVSNSVRFTLGLGLAGTLLFLAAVARRKLTTPRKWLIAGGVMLVFLFGPVFRLVAAVPVLRELFTSSAFVDASLLWWGALLAGCFVTDVTRAGWRAVIVVVMGGLLLVDYWPSQRPMKADGVSPATIHNVQAAYETVALDPDWVKTVAVSRRAIFQHGPLWSGKPQVTESFDRALAVCGMGALLEHPGRELWELIGVRYLVVDHADPTTGPARLAQFRQMFPEIVTENADCFVVRNPRARPYLTAYLQACGYVGEVADSARLALALAARDWPLVHLDSLATAASYERVYASAAGDGGANVVVVRPESPPPVPDRPGEPVTVRSMRLTRVAAGRVRAELTVFSDCLLVIAESYHPRWRATVDGRPAEVRRVNCGLLGLSLPAGQHSIELRYQPPWAYAAAGAVSLLTLLGGVWMVVRRQCSGVEL